MNVISGNISPRFLLFNHQIINSPPRVLATLPLPPRVCLGLVSVFSQFQTNSISFLPTESNAGEMFITFPRKKRRAKNRTRLVPTTFYATEGKGYCIDGGCVLKLDPHPLTPRTKTRLSLRTRWTSLLCLNV